MEYTAPQHGVSVSAYMQNAEGEVLLLRTHWRSDTWELPGGDIRIQPEEVIEANIRIDESNIGQYITRPLTRSRTLDAMRATCFVPYETWEAASSYNLLGRLDNHR